MRSLRWLAPRARVVTVMAGFLCLFSRSASPGQKEPACSSAADSLAAGQLERALAGYQTCATEAPSLSGFRGLAETYSRLGRYVEAVDTFHRALALNPDDSDANSELGQALIMTGRYEDAIHALGRSVVLEPGNNRARDLLAMALFESKQYELAGIEAAEVRRREPGNVSAAFILGACDLRLGLYASAIPLLKSSAAAAPSPEIKATLGKAYLRVHEDALALDEFRAVEQLSPEVPGLFSEIGAAYAGLGQKTLALKAYERALDIDPNDVAANYYLARLNWVEGNYAVSGDYLAKARQSAPEDPLVQLLSAEVSIHTQDYAQARPLLEKVVRELPENIRAHVLLSQVYIHLQQVDEAKREEAIAKALQESAEKQREQTMQTPAGKPTPP